MLTARLARAFAPFALVVAALVGAGGCVGAEGSDESVEDDELEESDDALKVGKLPKGFGAAGVTFAESIGTTWPQKAEDPTNGASERVFEKLAAAGVKTVRQAAYVSWRRGQGSVAFDVAAAKRHGVDLFVMVQLRHCEKPVAPENVGNTAVDPQCHDIVEGSVAQGAAAFKAHFEKIYDAANPGGALNVRTWSVNEPDIDLNSVADAPERAAAFYSAAREVLEEKGCTGCKVVAAELGNAAVNWTERYVKALKKRGEKPAVFGLHPYKDVDAATPSNWKTVEPKLTKRFTASVREVFPEAQIWLTEVGRMLHKADDGLCVTAKCGWASGAFVRRRLATFPGVARVYWWDMAAVGDPAWDSGLADGEGRLRAMYFGLMGYSLKSSLTKSKTSDPGPFVAP